MDSEACEAYEDPKLAALWLLAGTLVAQGMVVERSMVTATVIARELRLVLTCGPREEDGGCLWFWARVAGGADRPLAQADQVMVAVTEVKGLLA